MSLATTRVPVRERRVDTGHLDRSPSTWKGWGKSWGLDWAGTGRGLRDVIWVGLVWETQEKLER